MTSRPHSPTARHASRPALTALAAAADTAWTTIRVLIYYVAPVGFGLIEAVTILQRTGHPIRAYLLIVAVATIGIGVAWGGLHNLPRWPRRRRPVSASVRAINRRAAWILALAAVALATVMQIAATRPAGLWLLAFFGLYVVVVGLVPARLAHWIGARLCRNTR